MKLSEKKEIIEKLKADYPEAKAELEFSNPFELLVATILSAQATDVQVNKVTNRLFRIAGTPKDMSLMEINTLEEEIKSIGLYKNKAKNLLAMSQLLLDEYGGKVPETMEALIRIPGVGRKTANVVLSNAFNIPAIAVDTHVFRVANRIGLTRAENVLETEKQLMGIIDKKDWSKLHHCLIFHGRRICKARKPLCQECSLKGDCKYYKKLCKEL